MWIFGYGSLVWKVDFPFEERVIGYIKGYKRRFWQASIDHRGVPDKPGRVVTLVKSDNPEIKVWGCAYKIEDHLLNEKGKLNLRESKYTERLIVPFFCKDGIEMSHPTLVFIGTNDPKLQLGPDSLENMASQIAHASGPSGLNSEYLFQLVNFIRKNTPVSIHEEDELFELETEECVWGVAYKISDAKKWEVMEHLDYREKGGYQRINVHFYPKNENTQILYLTIYIGTKDNPFYTGPTDEETIAKVIAESTGPSGTNREYFFNLIEYMRSIGVSDGHLNNINEKMLKYLVDQS